MLPFLYLIFSLIPGLLFRKCHALILVAPKERRPNLNLNAFKLQNDDLPARPPHFLLPLVESTG